MGLLFGCSQIGDVVERLPIPQSNSQSAVTLSSGQPRTLDPARTLGDAAGPIGHIFSGLVTLDQSLQVQPELAAGWDVSEDRLSYTFFLHPNARFHDGRAVTASDVKFSWERALNPETGSQTAATYLGDIAGAAAVQNGSAETLSGVTVIDDSTLQVTLDAPKPYFLAKLTYPVSYIVDSGQVNSANWEKNANGSGPFILDRWRDDEIIVLEKNPDYFRSSGNVNQITYLLDAGLPLSQFENGDIDMVGIGAAGIERVRDPNDPLTGAIFTRPSLCTTFVGLNNNLPPFDDVRVRQAFNYGLDREKLIEGLFNDGALSASGILPPGMPGSNSQSLYPYNPELAQQLLREAGYDTSQPLTFTTSGYTDAGGFVSAVISLWEEALGVEISAELVEPFLYSDQLYAGNSGHFFSYGWCADYLDPENFLDILFHSESAQNWGRYANAEVDALLEQARTEPDVNQRMALYGDIEATMIEDAPYVFVSHGLSSLLVNPRIEGYAFTPIGIPQWHRVTVSK